MKEPKIRFKGFCGEWKNTSVGKECSVNRGIRITRKDLSVQGLYPVYQNTDYPMGYYNRSNVKANNPFVIIGGSAGLIGFSKCDFWAADDCAYFGDSSNLDKVCLYSLLLRRSLEIKKNVRSSSVPRLDRKILLDLKIALPALEEQQVLGSYFQHLDTLIQSTTKKIESLKQVKAASLQSMFPQEGETKPRVRFKGFEGEWEKVGFGNIFGFIKNNSFSRDLLSDANGEVKNIHYGDVLIKFGDIIDISKDKLPYIKGIKQKSRSFQNAFLQDGDVVITDAAEDSTVGKCSEILHVGNEYVVAGLHTIPCRPIIPFAFGYLGHYINSDSYHNQLLPLIQGSKISSISKTVIKLTMVMFPSFAEQQKIASYFTNLDSQITLQTQRLEKLKQIKSACLDNMFV